MLASNSSGEVGVVSNSELDGDDDSTVMVKTVQVGTKRGAGVVIVVGRRGGGTEWAIGGAFVGRRGCSTGIVI